MKDDRVGGVEDVGVRAVVLLEADHVAHPELALEVAHVADLGAAEAVDALVVVADAEHRRAALAALVGEELQPAVLQAVGVLELVDQDVAEAALVVAAQRFIALEQLVAAQQQLRKIHNRLALALRLILLVKLHAQAGVVVPGLDRMRAVTGFLLAVDEVLEFARGEFLVVDVQGLQQALDRCELVGRVEDLEQLRESGVAVVGAQQAVGEAVEGADPHAAGAHRQHRAEAGEHFLGGFVGECNREDAGRVDLAGLDQPGDAGGEHPRLARSGPGQDQGVLRGQAHRLQLFGVQVAQQGGHRVSSSSRHCIGPERRGRYDGPGEPERKRHNMMLRRNNIALAAFLSCAKFELCTAPNPSDPRNLFTEILVGIVQNQGTNPGARLLLRHNIFL